MYRLLQYVVNSYEIVDFVAHPCAIVYIFKTTEDW